VTRREIYILTIFPEIFSSFLSTSLIHKARERGLIAIELVDIRKFAAPPHYSVDDSPYGGGAGMVMMAEPLVKAIESVKLRAPKAHSVLLTPGGMVFNQRKAEELSERQSLIFICGRYEGVDQRAIELAVDEEISIGDYVLMGGEIPAMVVLEAAVRLMDDVIGNKDSLKEESFSIRQENSLLLEAPQYTKPAEFRGLRVPEVLLSGDHQKIAAWRREQALQRTRKMRPDLLKCGKPNE